MITTLFRFQKVLIGLFFLLLVLCGWRILHLEFEHVHHDFIPSGNTEFEFLEQFTTEIEEDDIGLFVAIDHQKSIFDTAFLHKFDAFTQACSQIPHLASTNSITTLTDFVKGPFGFIETPFIHPNDPGKFSKDSLRLSRDSRVLGSFVSDDFQALTVIMKTVPGATQPQADEVVAALDSILQVFDFPKVHIAGKVNMQSTFVRIAKQEVIFYLVLFSALIMLMLGIFYRTVWGVIIPLIAVNGGFLFFLGYLQVTGQKLDIMSTMFPTLMLIFGMADIIHLQTKFIDLMEEGLDRFAAMRIALQEIGLALFLTSLTTAIGFATLLTSQIRAIKFFGLNAAMGVLIAYLCVVLFASMGLMLFNKKQMSRVRAQYQFWERLLERVYYTNQRKQWHILAIALATLGVALFGISRISTNSFLAGDFPRKSELRSDYYFFEQKFNGSRSLEIAVMPKQDLRATDPIILGQIDQLERYLIDSIGLRATYSPTTLYKSLNKAYSNGKLSAYTLPKNPETLERYRKQIDKIRNFQEQRVMNDSGTMARITGQIPDLGSNGIAAQNAQIQQWMESNLNLELVDYRFTGISLLIDRNNSYTIRSLGFGLLLAIFIVGILFAFIFRDIKMVLVSLVPNVLPLLISGGAMGFLGIELKAVTSVIFTVSFGIAVDDTIHFLTRFKLERKKGLDVDTALRNTFQISGKAIMLTTFILLLGFLSLIFSDFSGTYYIGLLVSVTLVSAMIADLYLIPQLIYWINPGSRKTIAAPHEGQSEAVQ